MRRAPNHLGITLSEHSSSRTRAGTSAHTSAMVAPNPSCCPQCGSVNRRPLSTGSRGRSFKDRCDDCGFVWVPPTKEQRERSAVAEFDHRVAQLAEEAARLRVGDTANRSGR